MGARGGSSPKPTRAASRSRSERVTVTDVKGKGTHPPGFAKTASSRVYPVRRLSAPRGSVSRRHRPRSGSCGAASLTGSGLQGGHVLESADHVATLRRPLAPTPGAGAPSCRPVARRAHAGGLPGGRQDQAEELYRGVRAVSVAGWPARRLPRDPLRRGTGRPLLAMFFAALRQR
jgi:hypothetical protein